MSKRNKSTEQGYAGRDWIPPAAQLTLDHPTETASNELHETPTTETSSIDESFGAVIIDDKTPDSGVEGFAQLLDPSELPTIVPEPLPEPEPPSPTDAEIIESLRQVNELLSQRIVEYETQIPPMLDRATQLANEISSLMESRDGHAAENDRLNFAAQQLTTELASVREQLAVTHLERGRHQDEAIQLRSSIETISKSMLFQIYPRRGGQARTFIVAKDLSDAVRKFVDSGGKHEDVANVSMVADKLLI